MMNSSISLLLAMFSFSLAMSLSPGPVNMLILSSGVNYGAKKTIPTVSGATIGFTLLLLFTGLIFEQFIKAYPFFLNYLAIAGSLYILNIGYKIASSKPTIAVKSGKAPTFLEAFLLQWFNPKAWIACVTGASIFSSAESNTPFLTFTFIYFLVCYVSLGAWAVLGDKLSYILNSPFRMRVFNITMGLFLMVTAVYLGYTHIG
jgi:threonine/homoserine/homoserine lactone efflux protein